MAYNILKHLLLLLKVILLIVKVILLKVFIITFKIHLGRLRAQFIEEILEFDFLIYSTELLA